VAISPDNSWLAAGSAEKSIRLYDLAEKSLVHIMKGHRAAVKRLDFSPDSRYMASGSMDGTIILWDLVKGEKIHTFMEVEGMVLDMSFTPDGQSIWSTSTTGNLTRWNVDPELFVLKYYHAAYQKEVENDSLFLPRQKGEPRKDYQARTERADQKKQEIVRKYYDKYLKEKAR
jgi:WD40 repeat protein